MSARYFLTIIVFLIKLLSAEAWAADGSCTKVMAPSTFALLRRENVATEYPVDSGISPSGFVDLSDGTPVIHGIDVSKYQDDVSLIPVQSCGGRFAYVRVSSGSFEKNELQGRTLFANARAANLIPGPYHHLMVLQDDEAKLLSFSPAQIGHWIDKNQNRYLESAQRQAELFARKTSEVFKLDTGSSRGRMPFAIDLSERPLVKGTPEQKQAIGKLYTAMVCKFIQALKSSATWPNGDRPQDDRIVLFTDPVEFENYNFSSAPCNASDVKIWVKYRPTDGDTFAKTVSPLLLSKVCGPMPDHSRCLLEQYTSFGGFALFKPGAPLDLDRFLGTEQEFKKFVGAKS